VALIVETSLASGRDILSGVAKYVREHGPWAIYHEPRSLEEMVPRWLKRWQGDGIIARIQNRQIAKAVAEVGLPTVDVLGVVPECGFPLVHVDDEAIGRCGADHLLERGFCRFGFVSIAGENWSLLRCRSFARRVGERGHACRELHIARRSAKSGSWERYEAELATWIKRLPKPAGVMIASDQLGTSLLEACRRAGANVPDDVGVIGVDNDEPLCLVSDPPLSSIWPNHAQVGYEAAKLLDTMLQGQPPPSAPVYLSPGKVITRLSTNTLAVEDRVVAAAARFIRERASEGINVEDVVRETAVCRSVLQRRFKDVFQRTIHDEIVSARLARAQELLRETDLPLLTIAEKSGFRHQEYMGAVFKQRLQTTPARYRIDSRQDTP
jgi:LacI family transcriptional regulator